MSSRRRIAVVTGSRAEFGLLDPVMRAVLADDTLQLRVVVAGSHFVGAAQTWRDVEAAGFKIAARVAMQRDEEGGRLADAMAVGRGIEGFTGVFGEIEPDWVVVLGDRVEAFAAASAASIGGIAVAHLHGGDRAEGIADEAMRHAITKLAHMHLAATRESADRIIRMGEGTSRVHVVGSPAIDGLAGIGAMSDDEALMLGDPLAVVLLHPAGLSEAEERATARAVCDAARAVGPVVALMPNGDPGREWVADEVRRASAAHGWRTIEHLARRTFAALLRRVGERGGVLIGNSSAGLIEAAALGVAAVNVGPRQAGRERPNNVVDALGRTEADVAEGIEAARAIDRSSIRHEYGDGRAGERVARLLGVTDPREAGFLRKRNSY